MAPASPTSPPTRGCPPGSITPASTTSWRPTPPTEIWRSPSIPMTGETYSRYFALPRTAEDLLARRELIAAGTRAGRGVVPLVKEIGSDALFALTIVADAMAAHDGGAVAERVATLLARARSEDLAFAVAQTDVKGDRSLRPSAQPNPDAYLRIVDRSAEGIVVRGAKAHTTGTPFADMIIVLPTRAMGPADADYAVSFAVPVATPGLRLIAEASSRAAADPFDAPVSGRHKMVDTLTIFDDVFVPWSSVFLAGEHEMAGPLAEAFVDFHRFTAASYKLPMCELFIGAASLVARANGTSNVGHIRDNLGSVIAWTETTRALLVAAAHEHRIVAPGLAIPDPILTNLAKHHFADSYHHMAKLVQDIAGGLVVTAPSAANWDNAELRPQLERYLQGSAAVGGEDRARLMALIRDITASEFGGYQSVLSIHAEGSLAAQRIAVVRGYDVAGCEELAAAAAGLSR